MHPLISLVIPVYNVEKYLGKCLDSVAGQTYDNFEVILVDDGSTDGSGKLCDAYAEKDSRFVVYHKENGGLSDARNYGVAKAAADLVSFIDSDDYVTEDYLEYLWDLMAKFDSDMSCARCKQIPEGANVSLNHDPCTEVVLDPGRATERICCISFAACSRLYKKQYLLEYPFPLGRLYEDLATVHKLVNACDKVAFGDKEVYLWIQREGSITHSGISERQLDIFWALDGLYDFMTEHCPAYISAASYRYVMDTTFFVNLVFQRCNAKDRKKYFKFAREKALPHIKAACKREEASLRFKAASLGIYCGYWLYMVMLEGRKLLRRNVA